jgi:hypothetical protein
MFNTDIFSSIYRIFAMEFFKNAKIYFISYGNYRIFFSG